MTLQTNTLHDFYKDCYCEKRMQAPAIARQGRRMLTVLSPLHYLRLVSRRQWQCIDCSCHRPFNCPAANRLFNRSSESTSFMMPTNNKHNMESIMKMMWK